MERTTRFSTAGAAAGDSGIFFALLIADLLRYAAAHREAATDSPILNFGETKCLYY
jgi:hypothetical protein